jgi:hypothetical protein
LYAALYTHIIDKNFAAKITSKKAAQTARVCDDKPNKGQELEDLSDDIKQKFIYDYKACYSE